MIACLGTMALMMFYREVILPKVADGHPLPHGLAGHDQLYYHRLAVDLLQEMKEKGWNVWSLQPDGQAPAGILAATYYFIGPDSRVVIPLNALLHVLGTMALYGIVKRIVSWKTALILCIPYWLSPYQMEWFSQPNKDSFAGAGFMILAYGWVQVFGLFQASITGKSKAWISALGAIWIGSLLVAIVRPYLVSLIVLNGMMFLCWLVVQSVRVCRGNRSTGEMDQPVKLATIVVLLSMVALSPYLVSNSEQKRDVEGRRLEVVTSSVWQRTAWIPQRLDDKIAALMISNRGSYRDFLKDRLPDGEIVSMHAREALIDIDQPFERVADVIAYLPRATQIGFLAPFPEHWAIFDFSSDSPTWSFSTWYPRPPVRGIRMMAAYIGYVFFVWGVMSLPHRQDLLVILVFSCPFILFYALAVPHLGALGRYKYSCFFLLVTLGFACAARSWSSWSVRASRSASAPQNLFRMFSSQ